MSLKRICVRNAEVSEDTSLSEDTGSDPSLGHSYTVLTQKFGSNFIRAHYKLHYS